MEDDVRAIMTKIQHAQEWALEHFNTAQAPTSTLVEERNGELHLAKPACFVSFPDVDRMIVRASMMGTPCGPEVHYRLSFRKDGTIAWVGKHPIWDYEFAPLEIPL